MSENCNHDCSSCSQSCNDRKADFIENQNEKSNIKHIVAVHSGKGGVGKSLVTSMLATTFNNLGYKVGVLDADITGPSIPLAFGVKDKILGDGEFMFPAESKKGIKVMSINLLVENAEDPVVWRGPILASAVKQFYTDVAWGEIDYLFVDMPPGTGDIALTVFQSLKVDGVIIVSTPQDLVSMIVGKAVKMAEMLKIKVIGLIENMAYITCPKCDEVIYPFGESKLADVSTKYSITPLASLPIDPATTILVDKGIIENASFSNLEKTVEAIKKL